MSFGSRLINAYRSIPPLPMSDHRESPPEPEPWQLHSLESFVLAPGPAWRLLRSLFTQDVEEAHVQEEISKLIQR